MMRRRKRAFTLLETIVAVAAIAVLLALLLPSLGRARSTAWQSGSLSNMRQHMQVFSLYNSDFDFFMPYFTKPDAAVRLDCEGFIVWAKYFVAFAYWHLALGDMYYEGRKHSPVFAPPGYFEAELPPGVLLTVTPYWYSNTFLADPAYWTYDHRVGRRQWRATRFTEINYPSQKAVLFERWPYFVNSGAIELVRQFNSPAIAFSDGSVRRYDVGSIRPGHLRGTDASASDGMTFDFPTMHTIWGARGRDVD